MIVKSKMGIGKISLMMLLINFDTNLIESIGSQSVTCNLDLLSHTVTCKRKRNSNEDGIQYHKNGNKKYEGQLEDGIPHGKGIFYYEKGNKHYEGQFENGIPHGNGIYYYEYKTNKYDDKNLEIQGYKYYEGDFVNGKKHGYGKIYDKLIDLW